MKDPFQKRPVPAFLAALCLVIVASAAAGMIEDSSPRDALASKDNLAKTELNLTTQDF